MLKLLQRLQAELQTISIADKVKPISKIDELEGFSKYAISYEIVTDKPYKERKGKYETPIFINSYSNVANGDMAVLHLAKLVKEALDEADLTDSTIKVYLVKYNGSNPRPEYNKRLQAWQSVSKFNIRWEEL